MIIVFEQSASEEQIQGVEQKIRSLNLNVHRSDGEEHTILGVVGDRSAIDLGLISVMPGVREVVPVSSPYKLASREFHPEDSLISLGEIKIGGKEISIMAGPCAVESSEQIFSLAERLSLEGVKIIRGGVFKPRSSPYSFQGLGEKGLQILKEAADRFGLKMVCEVMTLEQIPLISEVAHILQVGARNMQNFPLLTALGKIQKPILLKRGLSATLQDLLLSAEYILSQGNSSVILCERGIRTFETATRNTLDLSAVPVLKHLSHLPVIVDPSHGVGDRRFVEPLARAAIAVGADGIMIEVHPNPDQALSDGPQSITPDQFTALLNRCRIIATTIGRHISSSSS